MYKESMRQTWVEIDLSALDHNIKAIKEAIGSAEIIGIVKADAYGHGSVRCSKVLRSNGVSRFAVATVEEALTLREAGFNETIIILGFVPQECVDIVIEQRLTIVVGGLERAGAIANIAGETNDVIDCLVAIDSGMGRIGYRIETPFEKELAKTEIEEMDELDGIRIIGMISHFSTSDEADSSYTDKQLSLFNDFYEELAGCGISLPMLSIANSAAIMDYPRTHFDAVRPGIIMYGCYPSDEVDKSRLDLEPVMSVKAYIVHLKTVPAGTAISYGRRFITERESKIATISIGYADGYARTLTGKAEVLVNGHRVPVVGSICMDQCMIDVTDVPEVRAGDEVVIMGRSGDDEIPAEELADKIGTINYEILCDFGMRLHKIYIDRDKGSYDLV